MSTITPDDDVYVPPTAATKSVPPQAWLLLAFLAIAWGSMWPLIKLAVAEIPLMTLRASSAYIGAAVLFGVATAMGHSLKPARGEIGRMILCSFFLVTLWLILSATALSVLPAGRTALLAYTMPFFALVLGVLFFRETASRGRLVGVGLGLAAVAVLSGDALADIDGAAARIGIPAVLGAAITWAVGSKLQIAFRFSTPLTVANGWMMTIGGIPIVCLAFYLDGGQWIDTVSTPALAAALAVAVMSQALGFLSWTTLLKLTDIAFASIAILVVPITSLGLSFLFLGEVMGTRDTIGMALLLLGLATVLPVKSVLRRFFKGR